MDSANGKDDVQENNSQRSLSFTGRRKYTSDLEVVFLKEVVARGAHVAKRGTQGAAFAAVASALKLGGKLPWNVYSKRCIDKFRAIVKAFRISDAAGSRSSRTTEEFGERETLLSDIFNEVDDQAAHVMEMRRCAVCKEAALQLAGAQIREEFMTTTRGRADRSSAPISNCDEEIDVDGDAWNPSKKQKRMLCQPDISLEVYLEIEKQRVRQEDEKICIESDRLKLEKERLDLEKAKFEAAKEEREAMLLQIRDGMKVQTEMLSFLTKLQMERKK